MANTKTYKVTFKAELTQEDVRAMNKCFFDCMNEGMGIYNLFDFEMEEIPEEKEDLSPVYKVEFNITGHKAKTLEPGYIGEHNGWIIAGEIHEDYYKWVNEFTARKINSAEWVKGNFETTVTASSKKAYDEFVSLFPPVDWDYWDI